MEENIKEYGNMMLQDEKGHKIQMISIIGEIEGHECSSNTTKTTKYEHRTVLCIPVYGQSYALGEEAIRITDFDSLRIKYDGKIVTEHMDHVFGYYDHSSRIKQ